VEKKGHPNKETVKETAGGKTKRKPQGFLTRRVIRPQGVSQQGAKTRWW